MSRIDIVSAVDDVEAGKLAELAANRVVLELGCDYGFSAVVMGRVASHVDSVDWFQGDAQAGWRDTQAIAQANLDRFSVADRVRLIKGAFEDVVPELPADSYDLVFIDGAHDYTSVAVDAEMSLRVVKAGGYLAFHDYGRFEVTAAIDDFSNFHGYEFTVHGLSLAVMPIRYKEQP